VSGAGGANGRGRDGGPDGVPLGRAFLVGPGIANDPLREAIAVVERVHGDGDLPQIPVVWDAFLDVAARFVIRDGLPSAIAVSPAATEIAVAIIHEIGHVLDFCGIGRFGTFASVFSPQMNDWAAAVAATSTYRFLVSGIGDVLARERVRTFIGLDLPLHWTADEFQPIDEAIEFLFRRLRWRRS
jgi:hypothetical protein